MEIAIKRIIQKFSCKHKDKIDQCENNKKNLKEVLDELYDEYHENEYKKWCEVHDDFLMNVKFELANMAFFPTPSEPPALALCLEFFPDP